MGLFDFLNTGDPEKDSMLREGLLQFGLGLMSSRGRTLPAIGNAGRQSLSAMDAYKQRQMQSKLFGQQQEEFKRKQQGWTQQDALNQLPSQYIKPGQVGVDATGGMETSTDNPANVVKPSMDLQGLASAYMAAPGGLGTGMQIQSMLKKDDKPLVVGEGAAVVGPDGVPRFFNPKTEKPEKMTSDRENYEEAKKGGFKGSFLDYQLALRKAGATNVSMTTGEKGFKNELALKGDFRTEPIYKDYSEMVAAYKQIKAGIAQGNPIGDLTTATKIMKLLDPTSVVRESELGMAMAATGRMDRLKNFVDLQIKGHKLTPQQRQEFGTLADELYDAAGQAYNQKRSEYENLGKRYELNTESLGPKHTPVSKRSLRQEADDIIRRP